MDYIASIRVGQNDIKALVNLESHRKERFTPILNMRGKDDKHLCTFLDGWGDYPFFMDISSSKADDKDTFLAEKGLRSPANAYQGRKTFYEEIASNHIHTIPVVSWENSHSPRDTTQFALHLDRNYRAIALRPKFFIKGANRQWSRTQNILNAVSDLSKVWVLLDVGSIRDRLDIANNDSITTALERLRDLNLAGVVILSTSFPQDKPASGTTRSVPCMDVVAQSLPNLEGFAARVVFGDYAGTNPDGVMEYVSGMPVIPFASYFQNGEWWQTRAGGDKEFAKYVDIAKQIRALAGYHGDNFCWATTEIARIATTTGRNGNNGYWNAIRINQHICAMLDFLNRVGFPVSTDGHDYFEDEEL